MKGAAMREYKLSYFVGEGRLFRKETDYANRSWWYVFESYEDGTDGWASQDGKPEIELTERKDCTL